MPSFLVEEKSIPKRRLIIEKLFKPIVDGKTVTQFIRPEPNAILIGLGWDNFSASLRSIRHPSKVDDIFLNYFEVWQRVSGTKFCLDKSYLHLDRVLPGSSDDEEILALHCDPSIAPTDPAYSYKSGPHMHFADLAVRGLDRSHIALCLGNREKVCTDYDTFCSTLSLLISLVDAEFLGRLA